MRQDMVSNEMQEYQTQKPWQRYLDAKLGLRDYWYPVLFSADVQEGFTASATVAGERLYFKRVDGVVYCVEDRCAHRGVPFSKRPEVYSKNTITCWFHGFCYDVRNGTVVSVLSEPDSSVIGKIKIKTYSTEERHSIVFVFIGDETPPHSIEEDLLPTMLLPNLYVRPLVRTIIKCNWRLATENGFDQGHLYLHRHWPNANRYGIQQPLGTSIKSKREITIVDEPNKPKGILINGSVVSWIGEVEGIKVSSKFVDPNEPPPPQEQFEYPDGFGCFLPCGLDVPGFPRADLYHLEWYVPIDEEHHYYIIAQATVAESEEDKRLFDKELEDHLAADIWNTDPTADPFGEGPNPGGFNNADVFGREAIHHSYANEDWWNRERLYKADYSVIQWRMLVHKHARGIQKEGHFTSLD